MTSVPKRTQRRIASDEAETIALLHAVALFQAHRAGSSYRQWQQVADAVVAELGTFKGNRWSRDAFQPRRAEQLYKQMIAQFRVAVASNGMDAPLPQNAVLRELLEKAAAEEDHVACHDAVDMTGDTDDSMELSQGGAFAGTTEEEEKNEEVATPLHQATQTASSQSGMPRARRASTPTSTRSSLTRASRQLPLMTLSLPSTPVIVMNPVVSSRKRLWDARLEASRRAVRRTVNLTPSASPRPPHAPVEELVVAEPNTGVHGLEDLDADTADDLVKLLADDASTGKTVEKTTAVGISTTDAPAVHVSGNHQVLAISSPYSPPHEPQGTSDEHEIVALDVPTPEEEQDASRDPPPAGVLVIPDPVERNTVVTLAVLDEFMAQMLSTMQDQQRTQTTLIQRVQTLTLEVADGRQAHERLQSEVATLRSYHEALKRENTELRQSVAVLQADRVANGADGKATLLSTVSNASRELLSQVEQLRQDQAAMFQKVPALEERVETYVNACTQLQADGTSIKESVKVLTDRLQDTTAETESWQALVEELADHTRTLEETVETHEGMIDAHTSLLATQDSTLQTLDATCRALDSVTQRLQEKIELEATERLALEDVVTADQAKWRDIQQLWQRELLGLKERHGEQPPVEEATGLKRMKEEISAVQETLASLHVRQKMRDDEMKMMSKRLEDRHGACTQQHVRVLRTIKAILESDA